MPENEFKIPLIKIIEEFDLEKIYEPADIEEIMISRSDITRPGLQIAGFFDYFDASRIQIMGKVEITYLEQFTRGRRCSSKLGVRLRSLERRGVKGRS